MFYSIYFVLNSVEPLKKIRHEKENFNGYENANAFLPFTISPMASFGHHINENAWRMDALAVQRKQWKAKLHFTY